MTRPAAGPTALRPATPADAPALHALLRSHRLPLAGFCVEDAVVAEGADGALVGVAALERRGAAALLRSVAVAEPGGGVGTALVRRLLADADAEGLPVALLTTTAERYFPRFGFARASRADVPPGLLASEEFRGACPASAVVMLRKPSVRTL